MRIGSRLVRALRDPRNRNVKPSSALCTHPAGREVTAIAEAINLLIDNTAPRRKIKPSPPKWDAIWVAVILAAWSLSDRA